MSTTVPTSPARVKPAAPTRSPRDQWANPNAADVARDRIVRRSPFNRQMLAMQRTLLKLRTMLSEFTEHDRANELLQAWECAGLPELTDDDFAAEGHVRTAEEVPQDAMGFVWAVSCFLATLDANVMALPRPRRAGRARRLDAAGNRPGAGG